MNAITTCNWCLKPYRPQHWSQRYCSDECSKAAHTKKVKVYQATIKARQEPAVVVVSDPDPDCGFSPGAEFTFTSFEHMLIDGTCTPGMKIRYKGKVHTITGRVGTRQVMR